MGQLIVKFKEKRINFPIYQVIANLLTQLKKQPNLVLQAAPGAGKSTIVPLELMRANFLGGKKIIMLEPRRVAVKSIAAYLAKLLDEKIGQKIGYQIRNERKISKQTVLEIVTEGVLTRRLQNDPELVDVGLIIFDEFHERSLHADLALMLALEVQGALREDLKLLVMSATIDTKKIANYLHNAPVISCPGKAFLVGIDYLGNTSSRLSVQIIKALTKVLHCSVVGDILIFLPGRAEIQRCLRAVEAQQYADLDCLPLYGGLPLAQQELVLCQKNTSRRRVIFATNIAETSLTIEGITFVIDSGLEKVMSFDIKSGLSRLETTYISKASATQRAGRAGRLQPGQCLRLWSESAHNNFKDFQEEEIVSANLDTLTLELCAWGMHSFEEVNWLTAPPKKHFQVAFELNQSLGLVDAQKRILPLGVQALALGVEPRLASMLLNAKTDIEKQISCILAALLSERDVLVDTTHSDIVERVLIAHERILNRQSFSSHQRINVGVLEQTITLAKSLSKFVGNVSLRRPMSMSDLHLNTGVLLLKAYPDRLAKLRRQGNNNYLLANGRGVALREFDTMADQPWLVVCDCDGKNKDGVIYTSAAVSIADIKMALHSQCEEVTRYSLDHKKEKVVGTVQLLYQSLVIEETHIKSIPQNELSLCVNDILQAEGLAFLNWSVKCDNWLARVRWLSTQTLDCPKLSEKYLLETLGHWLLPYIAEIGSIKQLRKFNIYDLLIANLTWQEQQFLSEQAPEYYTTPSNKRVAIRYEATQNPTVSVILQEMFGQHTSPLLAQGQIPLRFELLSPAKRPIQTTSDLGNFWLGSYIEVAKDMRAKYPRHRWPIDPLSAKPGHSIKDK